MDNVKIDILMATYNGEKYIKEQIESILFQTYSNFNLYIWDDASVDNTVSILRKFEKNDRRIKVFTNKKNIGSTETFKLLLSKVKSNLFMMCDQDDVWNINKIEITYKKLKEENADLVFTDLEVVDEKLKTISTSYNRLKRKLHKIKKFDNINNNFKMVYLYNVITGCTILSKSKYINEILKFENNRDIIHDHFISLIVGLNGKLVYLDTPTIKYRQHSSNQIGTRRYIDKFNNFEDIRKHLIDVKINIFDSYVKNKYLFNDKGNSLNRKFLIYFKRISKIKYCNFKDFLIFYKLYKFENVFDFFIQYNVLNFPILCKTVYNIKKIIKL